MIVKFLVDYKHTFKTFKKGSICRLFHKFGDELLKKGIVTDNLSRREVKNYEKKGVSDGK